MGFFFCWLVHGENKRNKMKDPFFSRILSMQFRILNKKRQWQSFAYEYIFSKFKNDENPCMEGTLHNVERETTLPVRKAYKVIQDYKQNYNICVYSFMQKGKLMDNNRSS